MKKAWDERYDPIMQRLIGGRTFDQIKNLIEREGLDIGGCIFGDTYRRFLLQAAGIQGEHLNWPAENIIIGSCYFLPYIGPLIKILDQLGTSYSFLEKEYCCSVPGVEMFEGEERNRAIQLARKMCSKNVSAAADLKGKRVITFCTWCAYMYKKWEPYSERIGTIYFPELILEGIEEKKPSLFLGATIGYYEGCHFRNKGFAPGVEVNWESCRKLLSKIEGLKVIEIPNKCCIWQIEEVIGAIRKAEVQSVVCACFGCHARVQFAAPDLKVKFITEIILDSLKEI
jgi:Fe-S oxidoreductase